MLHVATERLLPGETADRITCKRNPYGCTLCVTAFGRRLIVDFRNPGSARR